MLQSFIKMQGIGNDFVMIDGVRQPFTLTPEQIRYISNRRFGVGCDQILVVEKSGIEGIDFKYRIFNSDGGEVQQCGNGARCFAVFVRAVGLTDKKRILCETMKGIIEPEIQSDGRVRVNMGSPSFLPESLPFDATGLSRITRNRDVLYQVRAGGEDNWISPVSMGNPHAVKLVGDVQSVHLEEIGRAFQTHRAFPERVNVEFLEIVDRAHAKLRVFERGVGETLACGTGACAAAVVGMRRGALDSSVEISARGGSLRVSWDGMETEDHVPVYMTGPAQIVFHGEIEI